MNPFEGLYGTVPLFFDDRGAVDEATFRRAVARLSDAGLDGAFILCDPGEYGLLTREERRLVVEWAVEESGRVFVGVLDGCTEARAHARHADSLQASGVVVAPVGARLHPDGLAAHLKAVSDVDAPVFGLALDWMGPDWQPFVEAGLVDGVVGAAGTGATFVVSNGALARGAGAVVSPLATIAPERAVASWRRAREARVTPEEAAWLHGLDALVPPLWTGPALRRGLGAGEWVRPPGGPLEESAARQQEMILSRVRARAP